MKSKSTEHSERAARATAALHVGSAASSAGMDTSGQGPGVAQPRTVKAPKPETGPASDKEPANRLPDPDAKEKAHLLKSTAQ
jgi:hypothetical protein